MSAGILCTQINIDMDYDNTAESKALFTYEIIDIYERRKNYEKAFKYAKKALFKGFFANFRCTLKARKNHNI